MDKILHHINNTYPNRGWDGSGCQHIPWGDWHVMVDTDDGQIRIGAYAVVNPDTYEYAEDPTIFIQIPEALEDVAITVLENLTEVTLISLSPTPAV